MTTPSTLPAAAVDRYEHEARQALELINNAVEAGWSDDRIVRRAKAILRRRARVIVLP